MNQVFSDKSPLVIGVKKVLDIILLNFLWLITSVPLITLGVTTAALYDVVYKDIWHDRGLVSIDYFLACKRNLKPGFPLSLIFLAAVTLLGIDLSCLKAVGEAGLLWGNLWVLIAVFLTLAVIYFVWATAVIARFVAPLKTTLKNALALFITHLPASLAVGILFAACVLFIWLLPGALFILPALCMLACCRIISKVFFLYMTEEDRQMEMDRNQAGRSVTS